MSMGWWWFLPLHVDGVVLLDDSTRCDVGVLGCVVGVVLMSYCIVFVFCARMFCCDE